MYTGTHRVFVQKGEDKLYFCGDIIPADDLGQEIDVIWDWTKEKSQACILFTPDAWNFRKEALLYFKNKVQVEVERVIE